jgi:4-hydroxybenzoate polyprenyltransferase
LLFATTVNTVFLLAITGYLILTVTYSTVIKSYVIGDVIALAALYTLRLLGGSAAISEFPSVWLIAFSMFVFFSLALIKRCAELEMLTLNNQESSSGRDYRVLDVGVLYSLGISSGAVGILVFALYVADPLVASRFSTPTVLWLIAPCLIYWMARLWIKTARGEMHDDPIVFTLRDRGTRLLLAIACSFFLTAAFVDVSNILTDWLGMQ